MASLKTLIADVEPAAAITSRNLTIVPLLRGADTPPGLDYALASQGFERGELMVTEVDQDGAVGQLIATSAAEMPILLIDGEELNGAKQNRNLNTDELLRSRGKAKIRDACSEQVRRHA